MPPEPDAEDEIVKPDRLLLQINIDGGGKLRLNNDEMGLISTPEKLSTRLILFFEIETEKESAGNQ